MDGVELAVARLTPCGEETDDEGLTVVAEFGGVDSLSLEVFELHRRELGLCHDARHEQQGEKDEFVCFHNRLNLCDKSTTFF
jgi:hypothetical protein